MSQKKYYVYAYYYKSTGHIFHIGKGCGNRMYQTTKSRNKYFQNIIKKHKEDVEVKIIIDNLTQEEAWKKEKELIAEYRKLNQCETNFHEGGRGGHTGKYDDPERSRKLSEFAKTRTGDKNPNYQNYWNSKQKEKMSKRMKILWEQPDFREKQIIRLKQQKPWNKGKTKETDPRIKSPINKGKKMSSETYEKMMDADCPYLYQVFLENKLIFENISSKKLKEFCSKELGISKTIIEKVIKEQWVPTFKKHMPLKSLKIIRINRKCTD